ncbi:DNA polymerase III subunit epsilon [Desulfarculales bacterium]
MVIDLEPIGLDPQNDRVVSVGALRLKQGRVRLGSRFSELVNPGCDILTEAITVHSIKPDMLTNARHVGQIFQDVLAYLGHDILVAHYASFNLHSINRTMQSLYGLPLQNLVLDTVPLRQGLAQTSIPTASVTAPGNATWTTLWPGVSTCPEKDAIPALGDALLTAIVLQRLLGAGWTTQGQPQLEPADSPGRPLVRTGRRGRHVG